MPGPLVFDAWPSAGFDEQLAAACAALGVDPIRFAGDGGFAIAFEADGLLLLDGREDPTVGLVVPWPRIGRTRMELLRASGGEMLGAVAGSVIGTLTGVPLSGAGRPTSQLVVPIVPEGVELRFRVRDEGPIIPRAIEGRRPRRGGAPASGA